MLPKYYNLYISIIDNLKLSNIKAKIMTAEWKRINNGEIEGRKFELLRYKSSGLKVITTQRKTESSPGASDGTSHLMPFVISAGDTIEIEAETPERLEIELQNDGDFSPNGAREISNLAR